REKSLAVFRSRSTTSPRFIPKSSDDAWLHWFGLAVAGSGWLGNLHSAKGRVWSPCRYAFATSGLLHPVGIFSDRGSLFSHCSGRGRHTAARGRSHCPRTKGNSGKKCREQAGLIVGELPRR